MNKADFHVHTSASDGRLSPTDVVKKASRNKVQFLAITDHDTTSGIDEAIIAAKKYNLKIIPGVELSTQHNDESIHILGYFNNNNYKETGLISELDKIKNHRIIRAQEMIQKLKSEFNIIINFDYIIKISNGTIARPHIAKAIMDAGYNYTHDEIFNNFIGKGCKAYVPTLKLSTIDGINLLKKYDAYVFLAHPKLIKNTHISELLKFNFDGLESIYFQNTLEETKEYLKIAEDFNLLISCGSDFHGIPNDTRHGDIGSMDIPDSYLEKLLRVLI